MKRIFSFILLAVMLFTAIPMSSISAEERKLPFTDVNEDQWFYEAVKYNYDHGIFKGIDPEGKLFAPDRSMTRMELATTLFRMTGIDESAYQGSSAFPDVPENSWMTAPANWASEKGYVLGNDAGEFMPNLPLDRQTLATMIYRFAKDQYDSMEARETAFIRFNDYEDTADWAKEAMTWMTSVELVNGMGQTIKGAPTLAPENTSTRAQVAQILMKFANLQYNEEYNVGDIIIANSSISEYTVVYGSGHDGIAAKFADYIKMATGIVLNVVADTNHTVGEKEILIGKTNREGVTVEVDRSVCTDNEAILIMVQNGNLILTSNEKKYGTEYAVYDFLEHFAGINFLSDVITVDIKKAFTVPEGYYLYETAAVTGYRVFSCNYCVEEWKMDEINDFKGFYHSLPSLGMDPSKFDGSWETQTSVHKDNDPCLTDPKIQQNIITNARKLAASGKAGIWVGMSDGENYCRCMNCQTYYREHGRMGPYFIILDMIADSLEEDYPDTQIIGLAYKYIWSMLEGYNAEDINDSVGMFICTDNMCGTHSITSTGCQNQSKPNNTFVKNLGGNRVKTYHGYRECYDKLVELCPNLYVWDYTYPANNNEQPLPFFHRMYDNYTYFFKTGVNGMFRQNTLTTNSSFGYLRNYMAAQLLRDGDNLTEKEYWQRLDDYLKEYYGDGWTYIREYIDCIYELSQENEWHIWSNEDWNDVITEEQYRENFDYLMGLWETAASLAQTDDMKYRVKRDSTQMKFIEVCLAYETYAKDKTDENLAAFHSIRDAYITILETYDLEIPNIGTQNPADWSY